jgi:hypothetical protein
LECHATKDGGHEMSFRTGGACMRPGLTPAQQKEAQARLDARWSTWLPFVKSHADVNGDGFVSTEEARTLKRRVELGFCAQGLPEKDADGIAKRLVRKPDDVRADLVALTALRDDAKKAGLEGMP